MNQTTLLIQISFALVLFSPLLAHLAGWLVWRRIQIPLGKEREAMPSFFPAKAQLAQTLSKRFDQNIRRATPRVIDFLLQNPTKAESKQIAAQLGLEPEIISVVLHELADKLPHQLRVTQSGKLLYDFSNRDLAQYKERWQFRWPFRILYFFLALLANFGAAWPLFASLGIGFESLAMIKEEGVVASLGIGLLAIAILAVAIWFASLLIRIFLLSWIAKPGLANPLSRADSKKKRKKANKSSSGGSAGNFGDIIAGIFSEGIVIILVIVLVVLFAVAILGALVGAFVWIRGIWRAITQRKPLWKGMSPGDWIRHSEEPDTFSWLVPTNEVAIHLLSLLRFVLARRRPTDKTLPARILSLATQGNVCALDIALAEGMDLEEAITVGSRLVGQLGGEILVSDSGAITFSFPKDVLAKPISGKQISQKELEEKSFSSFESFSYRTKKRPKTLKEEGVAINIPGLTLRHLRAAERLTAGLFLLAAWLSFPSFDETLPSYIEAFSVFGVVLLYLSSLFLLFMLRYAAKSQARLGIRRDIRRAVCKDISLHLLQKNLFWDSGKFLKTLMPTLQILWSGFSEKSCKTVIEAMCLELKLELDIEASATTTSSCFDLRPLLADKESLETLYQQPTLSQTDHNKEDQVVFSVSTLS